MKTYNFELFETKNTAINRKEFYETDQEAKAEANNQSHIYHKVILSNDKGFETYERGEMTEWSYPNGLGQIKANS